jgi:hypothetical protein
MDAPNSPASTGVNLSPFFGPGSGFSQNDPGKAFLQTLGVGAGGAALLASGPAAVALGRAAIQAIPGQALGAFMELSGAAIDTNAARNVTQVVLQEGYPDFLEGMEQVGALYRSLEVPEVAGPEIPWGPQ